jgi:acyl-CoA hydrolase
MTDGLQDRLGQWEPDAFVDWLDRLQGADETQGRGTKRPEIRTTYQEMTPVHANPQGNVHGGEIYKQMDEIAGITAKAYAERDVVTASSDQVTFEEPVDVGDTLYLEARVDYVGTSSMVVHVDVYVEDHGIGDRDHTTDAYLTFVAVDDAHRPVPVPELDIGTPEEQKRYDTAKAMKEQLESR